MVFSSLGFLYLFLPAVLILHTILPKRAKNAVLLLSSLLFYFVGEQILTLLMIASALTDYFCSLGIERFREKKALTRLFLGLSLAFNLGLLGYFKYADLLLESFRLLTGAAMPLLQVALPIGISFYTFQTMSYTIDVYRGNVKAERNFFRFATYVTIFPQLIAGPIVRYETVAEELVDRKVNVEALSAGIRRFCFGLGKKVLIANTLAELAKTYESAGNHTLSMAWLCALALPLQIYFDFSGYSDMAIGLGAMLGFHFPENFDHPFASRSATEFWRRWHMTLGAWFRDYLYIPLGGSRVRPWRHVVNLLIVWAATGLWHGAAFHFLLWGLWYGVLIVGEKLVYGNLLERSQVLSRLYFLALTVFGFAIFGASDLPDALTRMGELVGIGVSGVTDALTSYTWRSFAIVLLAAVVLSLPILPRLFSRLREKSEKWETALLISGNVLAAALLIVSTGYLVDGSYNPFLYFRF